MADVEYIDRDDRLSIVQFAAKLSNVWGEASSRYLLKSLCSVYLKTVHDAPFGRTYFHRSSGYDRMNRTLIMTRFMLS
ncbi:hypothetical protein KSP40_PGU004510 [Platanthera guangdongensis]|uniref:Uncharacterized protein n=1 Tax=Platanthera guangdongensis TaxID=2320717 RepID=A0ABR2MP03_9ASPA